MVQSCRVSVQHVVHGHISQQDVQSLACLQHVSSCRTSSAQTCRVTMRDGDAAKRQSSHSGWFLYCIVEFWQLHYRPGHALLLLPATSHSKNVFTLSRRAVDCCARTLTTWTAFGQHSFLLATIYRLLLNRCKQLTTQCCSACAS